MSKHMKTFLNVISWLLILALFLSALWFWAMGSNAEEANEDEKPHFVYAAYAPGEGVSGLVEIQDGFRRCYVVAKFWTSENTYIPAIMSLNEDGKFSCQEATEASSVTLWIVDNDFVFGNGDYTVHDAWEMEWNVHKPPDEQGRKEAKEREEGQGWISG